MSGYLDLLFGGPGDDVFLIWPDWLPTDPLTGRPGDPASADLLIGGPDDDPGDNMILFLGGNSQEGLVRDYVAVGYDRFLHRHRLTSLVWDTKNKQFVTDDDGNYVQQFAFFQARNIQRTVLDTRGGDDIVRADPGHIINGEMWGISRGDVQARATAFARLEIRSGSGDNILLGGAGSDLIVGGDGTDYIAGGDGDDRILGGAGNDFLFGNRFLEANLTPLEFQNLNDLRRGTPDSVVLPPPPAHDRVFYRFDVGYEHLLAGELNYVRTQYASASKPQPTGLPISNGGTMADAFALEGVHPEERLSDLIRIGDFNGDGIDDYLVSGADRSYVLLGPVDPDSLSRVDTTPGVPNLSRTTLTVRGQNWSYDVNFENGNELNSVSPLFRVQGRAEMIVDPALGRPARRMGDVNGDGLADLAFVRSTGSNFVISVVFGSQGPVEGLSRHVNTATRTITVPHSLSGATQPSLDDIQVHLLDWNGDGDDDVFVLGKPQQGGVAGYLFSGTALTAGNLTQAQALWTLYDDSTNRQLRLNDLVSPTTGYTANPSQSDLTAVVVGDVNRDGFQDLLIGNQRFIDIGPGANAPLPNYGRVYMLLGREGTGGSIRLSSDNAGDTTANYVWEGYGLGGGVFAVGDTNQDGYDEFAFGRAVESVNAAGSLFVVGGSSQYSSAARTIYTNRLRPAGNVPAGTTQRLATNPDATRNVVLAEIQRDRPEEHAFAHGRLELTAGDFDGDGRTDLAVGTPSVFFSSDPRENPAQQTQTADPAANRVYVFWGIGDVPLDTTVPLAERRFTLTEADAVLVGEADGDRFGRLPSTQGIDLDGDRIDDLLIGAPAARVTTAVTTNNAGRVYAIYGAPRQYELPTGDPHFRLEYLTNRDVPGSGLYLVESPSGQPFRHVDQLPPDAGSSEPDQQGVWYRFSTLGDSQIGDQIRILIRSESAETVSRPARPMLHSTAALQPADHPQLQVSDRPIPVADGTFKPDAQGDWQLVGDLPSELHVGGSNQRTAIVEVDLSRFLAYVPDPEGIDAVTLRLPFTHTSPISNTGTLTVEVLDVEADGTIASGDVTADALRFRQADGSLASSPAAYASGDGFPLEGELTLDLTREFRDALAAGKTRLNLRLKADTDVQLAIPRFEPTSTTRLEVRTGRREGLVADLFDLHGRRLVQSQSIIDMRSVPAGDYLLRVYDPFLEPGHRLHEPDYQPAHALDFVVEIEPPKVGDAHPPSDRDEIRGGDGDDLIVGNGYLDRLFGGRGNDRFVAEPVEVRDYRVYGEPADQEAIAPPTVGEESYRVARPSDFEVHFASPALELRIAQTLNLANRNPDGRLQPLRPLRATDLTQLVELDLSHLNLSDLTGIDYAVHLEFLSLAGNQITDISLFEPGIRLGREEQGELGLRNLKYVDLDFNPLVASPNQGYPTQQLRPLEALTRVPYLQFVSIDELDGHQLDATTVYDLQGFDDLTNLRWLSARSLKLPDDPADLTDGVAHLAGLQHLQYLNLNDNRITDVRPLATLDSMHWLELQRNLVSSIDALAGQTIINNFDPGYVEQPDSHWTGWQNQGAFAGDYRILPRQAAGEYVDFVFANVPTGTYDVYVTWPPHASRTYQAIYTVQTGDEPPATFEVDQRVEPEGLELDGRPWQFVTPVAFGASGMVTVRLAGGADGNLAADAVRLQRAVLPNLTLVDLRANPLDNAAHQYVLDALSQPRSGSYPPIAYVAADLNPHSPIFITTPGPQATGSNAPVVLTIETSNLDGDPVFLTGYSERDPVTGVAHASVEISGAGPHTVTITPADDFVGRTVITLVGADGPQGPGDHRGRTTQWKFDLNVGTGAIYGTKYKDLNGNGGRDSADPISSNYEPGIEGWTMFLDSNDNGIWDAGEPITVTDANGHYSFTNRPFETVSVVSGCQSSHGCVPVPRLPTANDDHYDATGQTTLTIPVGQGVLANDSDFYGGPLSTSLVTEPAHGTLELNPDGSFIYNRTAGYHGPDSFTYKATNQRGHSAAALVSIEYHGVPGPTVVNTNPSLVPGYLAAGADMLQVVFSEAVVGGEILENYQLQAAGPDNLLGTADDLIVPMTLTYSGSTATLHFPGLAEGLYRLTVVDAITDVFGNKLDGDDDGRAGGNWARDWFVTPQEPLFATAPTYPTGAYAGPQSVVSADINGDGILDLITANTNSDNITLWLGDGAGNFVMVGTFASGGSRPGALTVGDFNGDGRNDLAVVNTGSHSVGILLGNGSGGFATAEIYASGGSYPRSVAVGDFNGDGHPDLAVANHSSNTLGILLGNGTGGFASAFPYTSGGSSPNSVAVGDFNGDGKADLAVANWSSDTVAILLGNGSGEFVAAMTYASGGSSPKSLAVGDFNADGKLDLAVVNQNSHNVGILLGDGSGGLGAATTYASGGSSPRSLVVGDFNGDGKVDLAVAHNDSHNVGILQGNGSGGFSGAAIYASGGLSPRWLTAGDFNGDGNHDLAVANFENDSLGILLGDGSGGFATAEIYASGGSHPSSVAVGDFNGDGHPDLAVANYKSNNVGILLGDGRGGFRPPLTYASGGLEPISLILGDFNGDGYSDLAVVNLKSNNVGILLGDGSGRFTPPSIYASGGSSPHSVTVGDFNGDGKWDLTVANYSSHNVGVLLGDGSGGFAPPVLYASGGSSPISVNVGDFNGDGRVDLAVTNTGSHNVGILLGNGGGGFSTAMTYPTGGIWPISVTTGDFNRDGKLDLAVVNHLSHNVGILLGNGSGGFSIGATYDSGGLHPGSVTIGDFNGDGNVDLAVANCSSHDVGVLLGNGSGTFLPAVTYASGGSYPFSVTVGDFNGDGKIDLAVPNHHIHNVGILLGNGSGSFAAAATYASGGSSPRSLTVGDFNGDGKLDMAVANSGSDNVRILHGSGGGGFAEGAIYGSGGSRPSSLATGDFNGDGRLDLVVVNHNSHKVGILLNNGAGFATAVTYSSGGSYPYNVVVGDFNSDGNPDLAVTNQESHNVGILLGNGSGGFSSAVNYASGGSFPSALAVGDFDGDGNLDLAVGNWHNNNVGILLGNGNGGFATPVCYASGGDPNWLAVGDFNGDGNLDLAVANWYSQHIGILLGNGNGTFAAAVTYASGGQYPRSLTVGDFDGDGNLDLAVNNWYSNNVGILLGNGSGGFAPAMTYASGGSYPTASTVGDFNGDGMPDLAVANLDSNNVGILLNTAGESATLRELPSPLSLGFAVQTGGHGAGQVVGGMENAFNAGVRLEVAGQTYAPRLIGGYVTDGGQTIVTPTAMIAGLYVHREISVAASGHDDFVRTLEVFSNPSDSPITTTVRLVGNLRSDGKTMVFATSDGDLQVETIDQWIGTDDGDGTGAPAIIHYIHGPLGLQPSSIQMIGDNIEWRYTLVVPAGQTVRLASFAILSPTRAGAMASARNLVAENGFGGGAGSFSHAESIANFQFPAAHNTVFNAVRVATSSYNPIAGAVSFGSFHVVDAGTDRVVDEGDMLSVQGTLRAPGASVGPYSYSWQVRDSLDELVAHTGLVALNFTETDPHCVPIASVSFLFTAADDGHYTATLTLVDHGDNNRTYSDSLHIIVSPLGPVFELGPPVTLDETQRWQMNVTFTDPGDDSWTASVNYGDSSGDQMLSVDQIARSFQLDHRYLDDGTYMVTVTVTDTDDGLSDTQTLQVTVNPIAPIIDPLSDRTVDQGETWTQPGFFLDGQDQWLATVDYGDGSGPRTLSFTPAAADPIRYEFELEYQYLTVGEYNVTITVEDIEDQLTSQATFTITVQNVPPQIEHLNGPDLADEGQQVAFSALATDPGPEELLYGWDFSYGGDPAGFQTQADGAQVVHRFPDNGVYTVAVRVSDVDGGVAIDTLTVTVLNVPPSVDLGGDRVVDEGTLIRLDAVLDELFTDPGTLDTHTFAWTVTADNGQVIHGSSASLLEFVPEDQGLYTVHLQVQDNDGGSGADQIVLTVRNVSPHELQIIGPATAQEGQQVKWTGSFQDPGILDPHTYRWEVVRSNGQQLASAEGHLPAGQRTVPPFAFTPVLPGVYTVKLTVADELDTATQMRTLQVGNVAPSGVTILAEHTELARGTPLVLSGTFDDPGDDTWTAVADFGDGVVLPLNVSGRNFGIQYLYGASGSYDLTVTVRDSFGATASASQTIVILSDGISPTVQSVTVSGAGPDNIITDATVGSESFSVTVVFSDVMNPAMAPNIAFVPNVGDTLSFASSAWSPGNTTYTATYDVADTQAEVAAVDIIVSDAQDLAGNPQTRWTETAAFRISIAGSTLQATLANGTLTILDTSQAGADNQVTIARNGPDLAIADANQRFASVPAGGTLSPDRKTLTLPLALVTGWLIIDLAGGDDTLTVDFAGGNPIPASGLSYDGGTDGNELTLTGGEFHTSTFTYMTASQGSIDLDSDGSGAAVTSISYTGLEPIFSTVASSVVELIYTGSDETITIDDAGGGQTSAVSTLGVLTTFKNPSEVLRIAATGASDTLDIGGLASGYATIEITGDGASDVVNFNGPITFAADHGLTVLDVGTVNLPNPTSNILASGSGAVSITALRNIALASGSSITASDGDITLDANQQTPAVSGDFAGIDVDGGTIEVTGNGTVTLRGRGGDDAGGNQCGVHVRNGGQVIGGVSGDGVVIIGTGGVSNGSSNHGVQVSGSGTYVASTPIPVASPGRTFHEWRNHRAFAALKSDSSVVTWGDPAYGGNSSSVASQLQSGVSQIFSTYQAFAALKSDGSVVTWGHSGYGGDSSSVADQLQSGVLQIYGTASAFAALKSDGSVVTWGDSLNGGNSSSVASQLQSGVSQIFSNLSAFAALKSDGSVVAWGHPIYGSDTSNVADHLQSGVSWIFSNQGAFAALKVDGSVVTWGHWDFGSDSSNVADQLQSGVSEIFCTASAFAALKSDGSVITWGSPNYGGNSSTVATELQSGVSEIFSNNLAFAALKSDGSVVTWGAEGSGGDSSSVATQLQSGVSQILGASQAFAALKSDGSVVTWGDWNSGGDSSSVAVQLQSGVSQIFSTHWSFAALKSDGAVVTWGSSQTGGDSSSVATELQGGVSHIFSTHAAFAALKDNGSVVTWGSPSYGGDSSSVAGQLQSGVVGFANPFTDDWLIIQGDAQITSRGGAVSITGIEGSGTDSLAIHVADTGGITTEQHGGNVTLAGNSVAIGSLTNVSADSASTVTILPYESGVPIDLGNKTGSSLGLTVAELDRITAGTLQIGDSSSGTITVNAAIARPAATDMSLTSGGAIIFDPGAIDTAGGHFLLSPGTVVQPLTPGTDITAASVSFAAGSELAIQIDGTTVDAEYSQLNVAGTVDLIGAALVVSGAYSPVVGDTFIIVNNDGSDPIIGTFTGLPEGAVIPNFLGSGLGATITYVGGDGNDVVLDVQSYSTRIDMTIVHEPSTIGDNGEVASLPANAGWVPEWQSFWVEIWLSTPGSTTVGITEAMVDLHYHNEYVTAQEIQYGPGFGEDRTGKIEDNLGRVHQIGGGTLESDLGQAGYVLLARVRFVSTGNDDVPVDEEGRNIGPYDMQMTLASGLGRLAGADTSLAALGGSPGTELWAVMYDIDDNDQIDFGDLSFFAAAFGKTVGAPTTEPPYVWWADFDKSGRVDFGDLAFFAPNFGKTRSAVQAGTQTLIFPNNFPDAWHTGSGAGEGEGEAMGGDAMHQPSSAGTGMLGGFDSLQGSRVPSLRGSSASEEAQGFARQEPPATVLAARVPAAVDAMFARLGTAEAERTPPWLRPRVTAAGQESARIEASQPPESPVTLHSRSDASVGAPTERLQRWTEDWEPLEDLLSLLADESSDRLLDPHDALFAQAGG